MPQESFGLELILSLTSHKNSVSCSGPRPLPRHQAADGMSSLPGIGVAANMTANRRGMFLNFTASAHDLLSDTQNQTALEPLLI